MNSKGGFFELELNENINKNYGEGLYFNSGRNAFVFYLIQKRIKNIQIPYYICGVIPEVLNNNNIKYTFYHINEKLEIADFDSINKDVPILVVNYFGIKNSYINQILKEKLKFIIDCSQSFFFRNSDVPSFYSPRKFFGLADGGILMGVEDDILIKQYEKLKKSFSFNDYNAQLKRIELGPEKSYIDFLKKENKINKSKILKMSTLTLKIYRSINTKNVIEKRKNNFNIFNKYFSDNNQLKINPENNTDFVPMIYPLLINEGGEKVRNMLIKNKIYIASYWKDVLNYEGANDFELKMSAELIALPIDQRFNSKEIYEIISVLKSFL